MPMVNAASDSKQKSKFDALHKAIAIINTIQGLAFFVAALLYH